MISVDGIFQLFFSLILQNTVQNVLHIAESKVFVNDDLLLWLFLLLLLLWI